MKMSAFLSLIIAVLVTLATTASAQDPALHWYQFTISAGHSTETITGSSRSDSTTMANAVAGSKAPVVLEDIREMGIFEQGKPMSWRASPHTSKIFILPHSIVYYSELKADPVEANKPSS